MRRCVLDTDVLVAALRSAKGASREIVHAVRKRELQLVISPPLIMEYEAVLTRPEHLAKFDMPLDATRAFLDDICLIAKQVDLAVRLRPLLSDPDDDMVLETAFNGSAEMIVTFNTRHFGRAAGRIGCRVVRPGELLRILAADSRRAEEESL